MTLRIAIVEDEPGVLEGLVELVNGTPGMQCVGSYLSAQAAAPEILAHPPDVFLIDLGLPGESGEELISELRPKLPSVKLLVLTQHENVGRIVHALKAGADGYLVKKDPPARLLQSIRDLAEGYMPMSPGVAAKVKEHFQQLDLTRHKGGFDLLETLSPREYEVLGYIAKGFTDKEIADKIKVSISTVNTYTKGIYKKLQVQSRAKAVARLYGH